MRALGRWLVAGIVLLLGRRRRRRASQHERIVPAGAPDPAAELLLLALLLFASLCAAAFIAFYALDRLPNQTQLLGGALGLAFAFLAAASIVAAKRLAPEEELVEPYPEPDHAEEQERVAQIVEESGERFTRKRLLVLAAGGTGTALGLALLTPAVSLGPVFEMGPLYRTPWRRGVRLVDERGRPRRPDDVEPDTFYTFYPEGARREQLGAPLVVVRLEPSSLRLPADRRRWAPDGIVAYSKICTHAGCAVSLYRTPLFEPTEPVPALICPCHYSTFDPATGGTVLFGPAGRPLPQLPLAIDAKGDLRAAGPFSDPIGPSWWGVELERRST